MSFFNQLLAEGKIHKRNAQIAQLVEQRTENPRVAGSIPALGIYFLSLWGISSVGRALDF